MERLTIAEHRGGVKQTIAPVRAWLRLVYPGMLARDMAAYRNSLVPPGGLWRAWPHLVALGVGMAALVTVLAGFAAPLAGFPEYDYLVALAGVLGAGVVVFLIFGPSWVVISLFLIKIITGHQYRSLVLLPLSGMELAPRELWLFLLAAHLGAKLVLGQAVIRPDLYHYFFYLYAFYFVLIAAVGVWHQPNITEIMKEIRYPIFLGSYFVFITCAPTRENLWFYTKLILALTCVIALGASAFFFYTTLTGNIINEQGVFGDYVQRMIGSVLMQSVRPNGHMFYEVCAVVLLALLWCPAVRPRWKMLYTALLALLLFAMLITMMRTAYIAFACSVAVLGFLGLPRGIRWPALFGGLVGAAAFLLFFGAEAYEFIRSEIPGLGVSLRARLEEMRGAWNLFVRHPLFGTGMGSSFTGMGWIAKKSALAYGQWDYQTLHNVWMYFLLKGGLAGFTLVLLGIGGILGRTYMLMQWRRDVFERFFLRGLLAATAGQIVASLAMPRLTFAEGHVFLAMATAAFFILAREPQAGPGTDTSAALPSAIEETQ